MAPRSLKIKYPCDWSLFLSPAFSFCHRLCVNAFPGVSESPTLSLTLRLLHNLILALVISILSYQVGFFFYLQFSAKRFIVPRSMSLSHQTSLTFAFSSKKNAPKDRWKAEDRCFSLSEDRKSSSAGSWLPYLLPVHQPFNLALC